MWRDGSNTKRNSHLNWWYKGRRTVACSKWFDESIEEDAKCVRSANNWGLHLPYILWHIRTRYNINDKFTNRVNEEWSNHDDPPPTSIRSQGSVQRRLFLSHILKFSPTTSPKSTGANSQSLEKLSIKKRNKPFSRLEHISPPTQTHTCDSHASLSLFRSSKLTVHCAYSLTSWVHTFSTLEVVRWGIECPYR